MTRAARRGALTEILKEYRRGGFNPERATTSFGVVRDLFDILAQKNNPHRASDAGEYLIKTYDRTYSKYGYSGKIDCQKGCSYCCHTRVTASPLEVFFLAKAISKQWQEDDLFRERTLKAEALTRDLDNDQRYNGRQPCPMLESDSCLAHPQRPLACRAYASLSVKACIDSINLISDEIPQPPINMSIRRVLVAAGHAAMNLAGLDGEGVELGHALTIASDPSAELRWLSKEPVFVSVTRDKWPPDVRQNFDLMVQLLTAGPFGKDIPPNPWFAWPH